MMRRSTYIGAVATACLFAAIAGQVVAANGQSAAESAAEPETAGGHLSSSMARQNPAAVNANGPRTASGVRLTRTQVAEQTCVTSPSGGGQCQDTSLLKDGFGLGIQACDGSMPNDTARILGALPVGTTFASVTAGGQKIATSLANSVVGAELPFSAVKGEPVIVSWVTNGAKSSLAFEPSDFPKTCAGTAAPAPEDPARVPFDG